MNQELIDNLIKLTKFNNKKWKMIFQLSKDGINMFHTKCNNHVNTLTLIQTNKSYIYLLVIQVKHGIVIIHFIKMIQMHL